jgi:adenine-specific DNA-methyltransferase
MAKKTNATLKKSVEAIVHDDAKRRHIPTAEFQSVLPKESTPKAVKYPRNTDLDPQLVWRGKDDQDWSDLVLTAPPIYIQEKVKPKVLIDDLLRQSEETETKKPGFQPDLFSDFNGLPDGADKTDFYRD